MFLFLLLVPFLGCGEDGGGLASALVGSARAGAASASEPKDLGAVLLARIPERVAPREARWDGATLARTAKWSKQHLVGQAVAFQAVVGYMREAPQGEGAFAVDVGFLAVAEWEAGPNRVLLVTDPERLACRPFLIDFVTELERGDMAMFCHRIDADKAVMKKVDAAQGESVPLRATIADIEFREDYTTAAARGAIAMIVTFSQIEPLFVD